MKILMLLMSGFLATSAMGADFIGQGYFRAMGGPEDVPKYIRIQGDSGFYCILDDKSSFRFKILGDSMTTPMNGMDGISYAPGSGSLKISGEEKGEAYFTIFAPSSAGQYPAACVQVEAELYGTGTVALMRIGPGKPMAAAGRYFDLLGRTRDAALRSARVRSPTAGATVTKAVVPGLR